MTSTPPSHSKDEVSSYLTPRKNNCAISHQKNNSKRVEQNHLTNEEEKLENRNGNTINNNNDNVHSPDTTIQSNNATHKTPGPLSWNEARHRLKSTLEFWNKRHQKSKDTQSSSQHTFFCSTNLDILLAILLCIAFVILSFTLPTHDDLPVSFTVMQRVASILFLISSLASAGILNRWSTVRERDESIERRRCVTAFLKEMDCLLPVAALGERRSQEVGSANLYDCIPRDVVPRKNVEDVCSTYRLDNTRDDNSDGCEGQWHRIPSLLLVKCDHIALKVGDTSPAKCKTVNDNNSITINAGERLTVNLLGEIRLPSGKSTIKAGDDLLMLANGVQVFELLETPLEAFLNKEMIVDRKPPQILRQGQAVRSVLLCVAFIAFIFTTAILLIRPSIRPSNFFTSPAWTIPILSALCFLPITTPMYLFCLECIGTARILATVHPWASNQQQNTGQCKVASQNTKTEEHGCGEGGKKADGWLLCRYLAATLSSRLKSSVNGNSKELLSIPPASLHLLEKLGLVTAIALIDDELACEAHSTPQQLLIPSKDGGLKLLDLCPAFNEEDEYTTDEEDNNQQQLNNHSSRSSTQWRRSGDAMSLDSDDDDNEETRFAHSFSAPARSLRKKLRRRYNRKRSMSRFWSGVNRGNSQQVYQHGEGNDDDVQFEDPEWWQYLPSLKCIGLSCILMESDGTSSRKKPTAFDQSSNHQNPNQKVAFDIVAAPRYLLNPAEKKLLVDHLCIDRERKQLRVLARCIGFSSLSNELGKKGDLSSFIERRRLHIISFDLLQKRMQLKYHAMGLEESRNWSRLYTDADTVFVKDTRSGGDLVLTVGDARVVTELCPDWWQGENSTISPLTASDRQIIIETQNNWMLSDLDVQAFSYAPLPYTADHRIGSRIDGEHVYLLDNCNSEPGTATTGAGGFWSLVKNQIFLGLLGSSVRPRKEIEPLISGTADAGVRFVYFSPRNMRRTKELASQMGIDVAWNCAISLRPLHEGEDDLYRMPSNYADWDVNARLPHGVEDVKRHLEEVDNVPLLVSLYTDVTKRTTAEMVNIFQDYNDTVLSVGLSHLPGNHEIFSRADIAIGVDVLAEDCYYHETSSSNGNTLFPAEIKFIASISAHSSVFNLWGSKATSHLIEIIRIGRASLEAVTSSAMFFLSGLLSFGVFLLLSPCTASTLVPTVPALEAFLYVQIILHGVGLSMASTDGSKDQMTIVPPKNDTSLTYSFKQSLRWYSSLFLRSVPSSIFSQLIYLVALGELIWEFDSSFVEENCSVDSYIPKETSPLSSIIRCQALENYYGPPAVAAGAISLASLSLCNTFVSASFVHRTEPILSEAPWKQNRQWVCSVVINTILIALYLAATLERGTMLSLPWYFYVLFAFAPFVCILLSEAVKKSDLKQEKRASMMRRLQFETRLGMWSPKESQHIVEIPTMSHGAD